MRGEHHAVLHDHVRGFERGVVQQGVRDLLGEVGGRAGEDATVMSGGEFGTVCIGDPVKTATNEIDAAGFETRI